MLWIGNIMDNYKRSYCPLCNAHCGALVQVENNHIVDIRSDFDDPVSQGYTCELMSRLPEVYNHRMHAPELTLGSAIRTPLKKVDGKFVAISWDQAIEEVAEKIAQAQNIFYGYDNDLENQPLGQYAFAFVQAVGMRYYANIMSWEKINEILISMQLFGRSSYFPDFENSDVLMIIGKNAWVSNSQPRMRVELNKIKNNPNRLLIVVDPVRTETADMADVHVQIKPGTDAWFLSALLKYLLDHQAIPDVYPELHTVNIEACCNTCGVDVSTVATIAQMITSGKFSILSELGINHSINQYKSTAMIMLLQVLTGNYNQPGGLIHRDDYLVDDYYQGIQTNCAPATKEVASANLIPGGTLSDNLGYFDLGIFAFGLVDIVSNLPNKGQLKSAVANVPVKIAITSSYNETVELMDYVLPNYSSIIFEPVIKTTTWKNVIKITEPLVEAKFGKSTPDIIELLETRLNLFPDYQDQLAQYTKLYNSSIQEFYQQLLTENYFLQLKLVKDIVGQEFKWPWLSIVWFQKMIKFNNKQFDQTRSDQLLDELKTLDQTGTVKVVPPVYRDPPRFDHLVGNLFDLDSGQLTCKDFPFIVSFGFRRKNTFNNIISDRRYWIEMYPSDAEQLQLVDGDTVIVTTNIGSITTVCRVSDRLQPGYARLPAFKDLNLITDAGTPGKRELNPSYRFQFAKIQKG